MLKAVNTVELFNALTTENLYVNLIQQLNKDFQMSNLDILFEETIEPITLQNTLNKVLLDLMRTKYDDYLNLLYRVDISEKELLKVKSDNLEAAIHQVTFLILKRESQKVWLKKNFNK
ncbi:hypothetical protein ACFQ5N_13370 [Lutibacter holmesii]|uniref:Uncharacterized protein n=1 Tax=Lutibacter holmesii TaxID=1137985 RepID=A0ABW3WSH3_9FLAO